MAARPPASSTFVLFRGALTLAQLRERRFQVAAIAVGTHPPTRAFDAREIGGAQRQELMRLARFALNANSIATNFDGADATDAVVGYAHAVSNGEPGARRYRNPVTQLGAIAMRLSAPLGARDL